MVDSESSKAKKTKAAHLFADPRAEAIAATYADGFLDAAAALKEQNPLEEFSSFLADVLERNPEFSSLLYSGMISRDDKIRLIERAVAPGASPFFANFLRVLARHERLDLLPLILKEAQLKDEVRGGRRRVQVESARPLSDKALDNIRRQLAATLPFEPIVEPRTNPALLGGLVIRVGDTVYDSSLRSRLKQLRSRVRERSLHEIQSGRDRFSHPEGD
jgi:F-type H+-transporting ATPase subunit delta